VRAPGFFYSSVRNRRRSGSQIAAYSSLEVSWLPAVCGDGWILIRRDCIRISRAKGKKQLACRKKEKGLAVMLIRWTGEQMEWFQLRSIRGLSSPAAVFSAYPGGASASNQQ
jgi:hypothetical protein